jgi:hypothetical protein
MNLLTIWLLRASKLMTPLKWWWANRSEYPVLHQLALDYLSVLCEYFSYNARH